MAEVLLYTADAEAARDEIESVGGRLLHLLTDSLLVADLPAGAALRTCATSPPAGLDPESAGLAEAWEAARSKPPRAAPIPWDTPGFEPPD